MLRFLALAGALLLAGCSATASQDRFLTKYADPDPDLEAVVICHGYGCREQDVVDLRPYWAAIVEPLREPAPDAAAERVRIAESIGRFESAVGTLTGTTADVGGTFAGFAQEGQLDCVDEATNTTTYLTLLADAGLLRWNEVRAPMSRGFFVNGWPHTSAVVVAAATGEAWVVDSWFHPNGSAAEIVMLDDWLGGWDPEDGPGESIVVTAAQPAAEVIIPRREP